MHVDHVSDSGHVIMTQLMHLKIQLFIRLIEILVSVRTGIHKHMRLWPHQRLLQLLPFQED